MSMDTDNEYLTLDRIPVANCRSPWGLAYDRTNNVVYFADYGDNSIRKIPEDQNAEYLLLLSSIGSPTCLTITKDGNTLFVSDSGNHCIKKVDLKTNVVEVIAGKGKQGKLDGPFSTAEFSQPKGIVLDKSERNLYLCDASNNSIRKVDLENQLVSTVAGGRKGDANGSFENAEFNWPHGIAFDSKGNLYVADAIGDRIRYLDLASKTVSTVFGSQRKWKDGPAKYAQAYIPTGVMYDAFLNCLWFCDTSQKIRRYDIKSGMVTTLVGNHIKEKHDWIESTFSKPISLCMDSHRNVYISDQGNHSVWKLVYNRGRFWKYIRLMWIGHLKNNDSCWFAKIPREMVREISRQLVQLSIQI